MTRKKATLALTALALATTLTACNQPTEAQVVSYNLSQEAEYFANQRRIIFINGITDQYLLTIEGACSLRVDTHDEQLEVTCKTGEEEYKKHFLGLSDNVTYLVEQLDGKNVSPHHYKVVFRPSTILPEIEVK